MRGSIAALLGAIVVAAALSANAAPPGGGSAGHGCSTGDLQGGGEAECINRNSVNSGIAVGWYVRCEPDGTHSCCSVTDPGDGKSYTNCEAIGSIVSKNPPTNVSRLPSKNAKP